MTVGYERLHGKRVAGQMPGGTFTANKSRTFARPVSALYQAFLDAAWLQDAELTTTRAPWSIRARLPDGSRLAAAFTDKGEKSSVAVQHSQLADEAAREASKRLWAERLGSL